MHALAIDQVTGAVTCHLARVPIALHDKEVIILDKGRGTAQFVPFKSLHVPIDRLAPHHFARLEINEHAIGCTPNHHQGLVGIRETIKELNHFGVIGQTRAFVELIASNQHLFLAVYRVHCPASVARHAHQLVTPPGERTILGNHLTIILTAKVQILECELLLCHEGQRRQRCQHQQNTM